MKLKSLLFITLATVATATAQQTIPPFNTQYGNFITGIQLNGSYGTPGQVPVSTGTGSAWQDAPSGGISQLHGDGHAGPGAGDQLFTLETVNVAPGSCGDATHVCQITTNGKGLATSQSEVAIAASGIVSNADAGKIAGYGTTGTTVVGVTPFGPTITDPPWSCACDGSTDDTACIQAAIDANSAIQLPKNSSSSLNQCNVTNLVQNNMQLTIHGNQSLLHSDVDDSVVVLNNALKNTSASLTIFDVGFDLPNPALTQNDVDLAGYYIFNLYNSYDNLGGVTSLKGDTGIYSSLAVNLQSDQIGYYTILGAASFNELGTFCYGDRRVGATTVNIVVGELDSSIDCAYDLSGSITASFNGALGDGNEFTAVGVRNLTGNLSVTTGATVTISGIDNGQFCVKDTTGSQCTDYSTLRSAAGTPLVTCNSGTKGLLARVTDATLPTFLGTYISGGAVVSPVMCNGTDWITY